MFKKVSIVVAGVVASIPFMAAAQTETLQALYAELAQLQAQLQAFQGQMPGASGPPLFSQPICSVSQNLASGASGSNVAILQDFLAAQGYFGRTATGYFGAVTKAALVAF